MNEYLELYQVSYCTGTIQGKGRTIENLYFWWIFFRFSYNLYFVTLNWRKTFFFFFLFYSLAVLDQSIIIIIINHKGEAAALFHQKKHLSFNQCQTRWGLGVPSTFCISYIGIELWNKILKQDLWDLYKASSNYRYVRIRCWQSSVN